MNIVIDQGNTICKIAVFGENDEPIEVFTTTTLTKSFLVGILDQFKPKAGIISSVIEISHEINILLNERLSYFNRLSAATPLPINNLYKSPETLGMDRLAAAVGAWSICPGKNLLVIDMGTAITYDLVGSDSTYRGGNIAPGLKIRLRALHEFTGRLPVIEPRENFETFGNDTQSAIRAGVMQGIIYETEGYLRENKAQFPDLFAFLTGGDLIYFAEKLKNGIFVSRNLVLIGLNRILNYNVCK